MVVDASAVVEWLMGTEKGEAVAREMAGDSDGLFFAPDLLDVEVVQAFRRMAHARVMTEDRTSAAVALLPALPIDRRSAGILVPRMWALRDNLTAYDAAYVALAEALGCPLLTCDKRCAEAPGHGAEVRLIG